MVRFDARGRLRVGRRCGLVRFHARDRLHVGGRRGLDRGSLDAGRLRRRSGVDAPGRLTAGVRAKFLLCSIGAVLPDTASGD